MFRAVRRVWVTVLIGVLGLVVGLMIGFTVGLLQRSADATWLEAVGTWAGAGITAIAVVLAGIVFFSEEFTRRREHRRQREAAEDARQVERAKLQQQADLVACDVCWETGNTVEPGVVLVSSVVVVALNNSSHAVRNVFYHVQQIRDETIKLSDVLLPGEPARQTIQVPNRFTVHEDNHELRESAEFIFSLGGVNWAGRYGQPAARTSP